MYNLEQIRQRLRTRCASLHERLGTPVGRVSSDRTQCLILLEYCNFEVVSSWEVQEILDRSDSALDDLICKRKVESLREALVMLQKQIDAIEKIRPCRNKRTVSLAQDSFGWAWVTSGTGERTWERLT